MANVTLQVYDQPYVSFSGADIIPTFNDKVIGEIQAITFSITRERAPIYALGNPTPISFSRGN